VDELEIAAEDLEPFVSAIHLKKDPLLQPSENSAPYSPFFVVNGVTLFQGDPGNCHDSHDFLESIYSLSKKIPKSPPNSFKVCGLGSFVMKVTRNKNKVLCILKSNIRSDRYSGVTSTLRIKTSRTIRAIDQWKERFANKNLRFLGGMSILLSALAFARSRATIILAFLILSVCIEFAAVQFASIVLLGFFMLKLQFYRFSNFVLMN